MCSEPCSLLCCLYHFQRFVINVLVIYPVPTTATCTLPRGCNTISFSPCLNNGTCVGVPGVAEGPAYNCSCTDDYFGPNCQYVDACATMPCQNGGECLTDPSNFNLFICICPDGITGELCETRVSPCAGNPCMNQATCQEIGYDDFQCLCLPGYNGTLCEDDINECQDDPCQNGGTCMDDVNSFSCTCLPDFSGPTCEIQVIFCSEGSCQNGGTCIELEDGFSCTCPVGYTGETCEDNINECGNDPCGNETTCFDLVGDFFCLCAPGFTGQFCNETINFCVNQSCSENGECSSLTTGFECLCNPGYTGVECEMDIDECESSPCENNATCLQGIAFFMCLCPEGFTGQRCEVDIDECASSPCENGATCFNNVGDFTCVCPPGFTGPTCGRQTDFCIDQLCYNGGTCMSGQSGFTCSCPEGWSGPVCQYADSVAVKLMSCGLFSHDFLNDSGYADPVAFSNGNPALFDYYATGQESSGLYWSAWIWQQNSEATALFSYEGMDFFEVGTTELVSDISNQQLRFYHNSHSTFGHTINATLDNIPLSTNKWHHLTTVMLHNGTVVISVDGVYTRQGAFEETNIITPGSEIPQRATFSTPSSFNFTVARSSVHLSTQSQQFTGVMRGVAIANIPSTVDRDLPSLDQCLLSCIGGDDFCSNLAQCQDQFGPNRRCSCSYGFTGLQCQYIHDRFSFDGTGYVGFTNGPPSVPPFSFGFKSESTSGELCGHTGIFTEGSFSLEDGAVVFNLQSCDSTNTSLTLQPSPSETLNNLQWHTITATQETVQLDDNSPQTYSFQTPACNNSNSGRITLGSFSETADMSNNFIGCLRDLLYDGNLLDATSVELVGGAQFGCDHDTAQFFATSYLELPNFDSRESQTISFDVSTLASEAVLYFSRREPADATGPNPTDFVAIYLEGGQVTFTFNLGEGDVTVRNNQPVSDGNWHYIEAMQNSTLSWLSVDGIKIQRPVVSQLELLDTTGSVFLGGVPTEEQFSGFNQFTNFDGCLRDLEQNGLAADLRNSTAVQHVRFGTCN